jgi:hypothetical protein
MKNAYKVLVIKPEETMGDQGIDQRVVEMKCVDWIHLGPGYSGGLL